MGLLCPVMNALWNLTFCRDFVRHARKVGGVDRVLTVMREQPNATELQASSCGVLMNFAVDEQNRLTIAQTGASLIVAAMRQHSHNNGVLEQGSQVLYLLASYQELKPHLLSANAGEAATIAATSFSDANHTVNWGQL